MGYVPRPINSEVFWRMTPEDRAAFIQQEREFHLRVMAEQGGTLGFGYGILIALAVALIAAFPMVQ